MIICIDFDGTLAEHCFPEIGREVEGAFEWMRIFQEAGAQLILWTMRDDGSLPKKSDNPLRSRITQDDVQTLLTEAVEFCRERGVEFWGVNVNPEQCNWSTSPKCYAHLYIDDAAFGCPLIYPEDGRRPYVDWSQVGPTVLARVLRCKL